MTPRPKSDAATLAHDLRGPLHTILALSDLLHNDIASSNEQRRELAALIEAAGRDLLDVINDLVALARASRHCEVLEPGHVSLADAARSAISALRVTHPRAVIDADCHAALPPFRSDAGLIRRLMIALGDHAIRSSGDDTRVALSVETMGAETTVIAVTSSPHAPAPPISACARATLSLDLAQALACLLGGNVVTTSDVTGRCVSVRLPALRAMSGSSTP